MFILHIHTFFGVGTNWKCGSSALLSAFPGVFLTKTMFFSPHWNAFLTAPCAFSSDLHLFAFPSLPTFDTHAVTITRCISVFFSRFSVRIRMFLMRMLCVSRRYSRSLCLMERFSVDCFCVCAIFSTFLDVFLTN